MTHYSNTSSHVRVDVFKCSGPIPGQPSKWYMTEMLDMKDEFFSLMSNEMFQRLWRDQKSVDGKVRGVGMTAFVLDPYNENSHPQVFQIVA